MTTLTPVYIGMYFHYDKVDITLLLEKGSEQEILLFHKKEKETVVKEWLIAQRIEKKRKCVAVGFASSSDMHQLGSSLWLEEDIVSYFFSLSAMHSSAEIAMHVRACFDSLHTVNVVITKEQEVCTSFLTTRKDYEALSEGNGGTTLAHYADEFRGKRIVFFSATPRGGGVALMRHALIRLFGLYGIDAHWYVMQNDPESFVITKRKFHNVLQGVAAPDVVLTDDDKKTYNTWIGNNAGVLSDAFRTADIAVVDDPQPAGLVPYIRKVNNEVKVIYRSHIQIMTDAIAHYQSQQQITWEFLWGFIQSADCFLFHPIPAFAPPNIPKEKVLFAPPSTDPMDGLNKPLSTWQEEYYLQMFQSLLLDQEEALLDSSNPFIIQIARFDPSKGIPDLLDAFALLHNTFRDMNTQLIIAGDPSVDDPDRAIILPQIKEQIQSKYSYLAPKIKVVMMSGIDQMLNMILRRSVIDLQLSHREGFEIKVTEALMKGKPVIVTNAGGIPLQVVNHVDGYIVPVADIHQVANDLHTLLTDNDLFNAFSQNAITHYGRDYLTYANAIRWMQLSLHLLHYGSVRGFSFQSR